MPPLVKKVKKGTKGRASSKGKKVRSSSKAGSKGRTSKRSPSGSRKGKSGSRKTTKRTVTTTSKVPHMHDRYNYKTVNGDKWINTTLEDLHAELAHDRLAQEIVDEALFTRYHTYKYVSEVEAQAVWLSSSDVELRRAFVEKDARILDLEQQLSRYLKGEGNLSQRPGRGADDLEYTLSSVEKENHGLKEVHERQTAEIQTLEEETRHLKEALTSYQGDNLAGQLERFREELEAARNRKSTLESENATLSKTLATKEKEASESQGFVVVLREDSEKQKSTLAEFERALAEQEASYRRRIAAKDDEIRAQRDFLGILRSDTNKLKDENARQKNEASGANQPTDGLTDEGLAYRVTKESLEDGEAADALVLQLRKENGRLLAAATKIDRDAKKALADKDANITQLTQLVTETKSALQSKEAAAQSEIQEVQRNQIAALDSKDSELARLRDESARQQELLEQYLGGGAKGPSQSASSGADARLKEENSRLQAEIERLLQSSRGVQAAPIATTETNLSNDDSAVKVAEITRLKQEVMRLEGVVTQIKKQTGMDDETYNITLTTINHNSTTEVAKLQEEINAFKARAAGDNSASTIASLQAELKRATSEVSTLKQSGGQVTELSARIQSLQSENGTLQSSLNGKITTLLSENESLRAQLGQLAELRAKVEKYEADGPVGEF